VNAVIVTDIPILTAIQHYYMRKNIERDPYKDSRTHSINRVELPVGIQVLEAEWVHISVWGTVSESSEYLESVA
jgi:hypothetical protein